MAATPELDRLIAFYHTLTPASLSRFPEFYSRDAYFKDPFNEVTGVDAIARIFRHMFSQLENPRFIVTECIANRQGAMLIWEFHYQLRRWKKGEKQHIHGISHLKLGPDGKVKYHRDYWDAAEELYMKLPLIGRLMRYLRNRLGS